MPKLNISGMMGDLVDGNTTPHEVYLGMPWNPGGSPEPTMTKEHEQSLRYHLIVALCQEPGENVLLALISTLPTSQLININNRLPYIQDLVGELDDSLKE